MCVQSNDYLVRVTREGSQASSALSLTRVDLHAVLAAIDDLENFEIEEGGEHFSLALAQRPRAASIHGQCGNVDTGAPVESFEEVIGHHARSSRVDVTEPLFGEYQPVSVGIFLGQEFADGVAQLDHVVAAEDFGPGGRFVVLPDELVHVALEVEFAGAVLDLVADAVVDPLVGSVHPLQEERTATMQSPIKIKLLPANIVSGLLILLFDRHVGQFHVGFVQLQSRVDQTEELAHFLIEWMLVTLQDSIRYHNSIQDFKRLDTRTTLPQIESR